MSQKFLYRTACFILGFGIGVIYFASPATNHQRAAVADGFTGSDKPASNSVQQEAPVVPTVADVQALKVEEDKLAALEAELLKELSGQPETSSYEQVDVSGNSHATIQTQDNDAPAQVQKTEVSTEAKSAQVTQEPLTSATEDAQMASTVNKAYPRAMPRPGIHARAQLRRSPVSVPDKITRTMYLFEDAGSAAKEYVLEIDVRSSLPGSDMVPFSFENIRAPKRAAVSDIVPVTEKVSAGQATTATQTASSAIPKLIAKQVTDLKQENIDLREQVLSLRVMMQAIEEDAEVSATAVTASPYDSMQAPQVVRVTKQTRQNHDSQQFVQDMQPVDTYGYEGRQPKGSFEAQPGDPVIVRYDRTPLRTGPGTHYSRVAVLREGTQLKVDYHRQGWFRVYTADGVRAWIAEDAIRWF